MEKFSQLQRKIVHLPGNIAIAMISLYQRTLSPDHGYLAAKYPHGYCRHWPSCSEYTKLSIRQSGLILGSAKGFWRILRCNPFSRGGVDMPMVHVSADSKEVANSKSETLNSKQIANPKSQTRSSLGFVVSDFF